jgi:mono/diheme cytochrome c family protein
MALNKPILLVVVGLFIVGIAACAPAATPTAAPTVPPAPTVAPTVAPTQPPAPTSEPTAAATEAPAEEEEVARPSNGGGAGEAVVLAPDVTSGQQIFEENCVTCHGEKGVGGVANPGSVEDIPELNPIDDTMVSSDYLTYAFNIDLFMEHGSSPEGPSPTFNMPAWGDDGKLTPQQISDVIAYVISLNDPNLKPTVTTSEPIPADIARPSNPGGAGEAITLTGDTTAGATVFTDNCVVCHGDNGKGGVGNPGSVEDIPELNPIDETLKSPDPLVYAYNLDLFMEHGSTPEGTGPTFTMPAWGDNKELTPQQIADVIAYVISINK